VRRWPRLECMKRSWPGEDPTDVAWVPLREDSFVEAGDVSLWVVHTPGHSPDHVCFFEPRSGVLFAGDLVLNGGTVVIPPSLGGHLASYLRSLHRVLELQPRVILAGHGPVIHDPAALVRGYITHRQHREQQIVRTLQEAQRPLTLAAIVDRVYDKLAPELRTVAQESALAHLIMLEENGAARQTSDGWELST
jgi:endoribonuclease LACTB2